jgi:hypothetical protein
MTDPEHDYQLTVTGTATVVPTFGTPEPEHTEENPDGTV